VYHTGAALGDLPSGLSPNYTPTAAELARAQEWADANGYGRVGQGWSNQGGGVFTVPTSGGGGSVRFGWGRGWFANFAGPGAVASAPAAAAAVVSEAPAVVFTAAPVEPPPATVAPATSVMTVSTPGKADVQTVPVVEVPPAAAVAPSGGGFNFSEALDAFLKSPAMQPLEAKVAAAAAPYAPQVATNLFGAWVAQHQKEVLLYGGAGLAAVLLLPRLLRKGRR
jgi:hypothetical protein